MSASKGGSVVVLAVMTAALSGEAQAQTADRCEVVITPSAGRTIPANAPALHYVLSATGANIPPEAFAPPQGIQLFNGAGVSVPVSVNYDSFYGYRIEPETPFVAGQSYRLRYPDPCAGSGTFAETQIPIGPAAPWPTASGALRLTAVTGDVPYTCFDLPYVLRDHPGLQVEITASPALRPFLPVVLFEMNVDALSWSRSAYGSMPHWFSTLPGLLQHPDALLYAACGRTGEGDPQNDCPTRAGGLSPGSHRLMVPVRILGAANDPTPLAADFTIDCDTGGFGSAGASGGGGAGGGGAGGIAGMRGGGGGCAVGGSASPGQALALAWMALCLVRRRRGAVGSAPPLTGGALMVVGNVDEQFGLAASCTGFSSCESWPDTSTIGPIPVEVIP
jgi:hypothetical protein